MKVSIIIAVYNEAGTVGTLLGYERLWRIDRRIAGWPMLRSMGDHFLVVMRKR